MQNFRLGELLEKMLYNEKARGISQKTLKKHHKFLKRFFEFLKKEQIALFIVIFFIFQNHGLIHFSCFSTRH